MQVTLKVGDVFRIYNRRHATRGVITKLTRTFVIYDAPYFKTSTSPDGWLRGLKLRKDDFDEVGVTVTGGAQ